MKKYSFIIIIIATVLWYGFGALSVHAAQCTFDRNLDVGDEGEDVRCLQKFLNSAGFVITTTGGGAPGNETTKFGELTRQALAKWQSAQGLTPPIGYFGTLSRQKYGALSGSSSTSGSSGSGDLTYLQERLAQLREQLNNAQSSSQQVVVNATESSARAAIEKAVDGIIDAEKKVDDGNEDDDDIMAAHDNLDDARESFVRAIRSYFRGDYNGAVQYAQKAVDDALDAYSDAGGKTDEDKADALIDKVQEKIDDAHDTIDAADDDGEDIDEAEDILSEAEDKLDEADDAFDDADYERSIELAEEAEDLVRDAIDAIGNSDKSDAQEEIDDAQEMIDDAEEEIQDAEDDGDDVDDAWDLLDDAKKYLDDAQDEYDDKNYSAAKNLAKKAQNKVDDALDEI